MSVGPAGQQAADQGQFRAGWEGWLRSERSSRGHRPCLPPRSILLGLPPSVLVGSPRLEQLAAPDCDDFFHLVNSELVGAGQVSWAVGLRGYVGTSGWLWKTHQRIRGHVEPTPQCMSCLPTPGL